MEVDYPEAQDLNPGDVVRVSDIAEIAEYDLVPPGETLTVTRARPAPIPGYTQVMQADGDPLYVRSDRRVPVSSDHPRIGHSRIDA